MNDEMRLRYFTGVLEENYKKPLVDLRARVEPRISRIRFTGVKYSTPKFRCRGFLNLLTYEIVKGESKVVPVLN